MTFKIACQECGADLYAGYDIKPVRDILKMTGGRCGKCKAPLSQFNFTVQVQKKFN